MTKRGDTINLTIEITVINKFGDNILLEIGTPLEYLRTLPVSKLILVKYFDMTSNVMFDVEPHEVSGCVND